MRNSVVLGLALIIFAIVFAAIGVTGVMALGAAIPSSLIMFMVGAGFVAEEES